MTGYDSIIQQRAEILGLNYPFSEEDLKLAFRTLAKKTHPDVGGSSEEFKKVNEAYEFLLLFCARKIGHKEQSNFCTVKGIDLGTLGKGLGLSTNAKTCDTCKGIGYTKTISKKRTGGIPCVSCGGSGKLRRQTNNLWSRLRTTICRTCWGLGYFNATYKEEIGYHLCISCGGSGEIEINNPVLKKGIVTTPEKVKVDKKRDYCTCGAIKRNGKCWKCNS